MLVKFILANATYASPRILRSFTDQKVYEVKKEVRQYYSGRKTVYHWIIDDRGKREMLSENAKNKFFIEVLQL